MQTVDRTKDTVICDLDGTIALDNHRAHHLHPPHEQWCDYAQGECNCGWKRDWDTYFSLCGGDEPNWAVIDMLRLLWEDGYNIRILSGRTNNVRNVTEEWLAKHAVPHHTLILREGDCREDDYLMKPLKAKAQGWLPENTLVVFEDRQRVVDEWRRLGYTVFQVAPGKF